MKKIAILCMTFFITTFGFAQSYSAKCSPLFGVVSAAANVKEATYEIIDYDSEKDLTFFTYTWTQETKVLFSKSYTQYKCFLNVTSNEENGRKKLIINIDKDIFYRMVNADGSKINGVSNVKGVTYEWAKNTTILNKEATLKSVVDVVEKCLYEELNKSDAEITKGMIAFFTDDINRVLFDSDSLGKLASEYIELCSIPAILDKLQTEKNEIWFDNYLEKIKDANFDNNFKVSNVKKSDVEGYKYIVECTSSFTNFKKDDFEKLLEGTKKLYDMAYYDQEIGIVQLRKKTFDTYKSAYQRIIFLRFYTNDDKVLDLNNKSEFHISGILHKVNMPGSLIKEITSLDVYEK